MAGTSVLACRIARALLQPRLEVAQASEASQAAGELLNSPLVAAGISAYKGSLPPTPDALAEATVRFAEARASFGKHGPSSLAGVLPGVPPPEGSTAVAEESPPPLGSPMARSMLDASKVRPFPRALAPIRPEAP